MRMPVLECVISGECYQNFNYNPEWDWEKVNRSEFSENNPFDFECMKNLGRSLRVRGGVGCVGSGISRFEITPFFNKGKVMSLTFLHGDGYSDELEWISRELELVCEQLRFFNFDYIEQEVFDRMLVEFLEYIIEKAKRYGGTKEEKIAFNKWICYFYGFYIESLQTWVDVTAKNARKLTDVFNDARVDPSPYGDFGCFLHKTKLPITYRKEDEKDEVVSEVADVAVDKTVDAHQYLGMLDWEYDEGKRFVSKEDFIYLVGVFARLLSEGGCPDGVRGIEMLNGSYKFVTKCIYDAHTREQIRKNRNGVDYEWVKFCQQLFPNNKFQKASFSKGPANYDKLKERYDESIGK